MLMETENRDIKMEKNTENVGATFIEFLLVIVKFRKLLFLLVFFTTITVTILAFMAPKWYKSTASVLPAERSDLLSTLSGISSLAKGFSASKGLAALTGGNDEADRYVAILQSQSMISDMIKTFNLRKVYDMEGDYFEKVVKEYKSNVEIEIQDEGNLTIDVYDIDNKRAAQMANYLVDRLNDINSELSIKNARANRLFIEKRYIQNKRDIDSLELAMKLFQQKFGVIAVPEQLEATVKAMSTIYGELAEKEVAFNVIKRQYGEDNPLITMTKYEMEELRKKITEINNGEGSFTGDNVNLLIPFKKAPELANEYIQIFRNLEIQYKILEFVTPMYEQAKVEEIRNTPSVLVLDEATPADHKSKPKVAIYALIAFVFSALVAIFIVFVLELVNRLKINQPKKYNDLVGWIRLVKKS